MTLNQKFSKLFRKTQHVKWFISEDKGTKRTRFLVGPVSDDINTLTGLWKGGREGIIIIIPSKTFFSPKKFSKLLKFKSIISEDEDCYYTEAVLFGLFAKYPLPKKWAKGCHIYNRWLEIKMFQDIMEEKL